MRVCYLCGQQFGSASISIHIPQCYSKKLAQWEIADPATRGKAPKHPDTVNWMGDGANMQKHNDEQFQEFTNNLVPCERCGRRFLPDRLVVHLRSCKGDGRCASRGSDVSGGRRQESGTSPTRRHAMSSRGGATESRGKSRLGNSGPGLKPQLPICYLCGQQFGTSSIGIHVPQCYAKKLAQWEASDVSTRGKPPRHPDSFNWRGEGNSIEEHNEAQFSEFVRNLEPCPNCGRRFLADRLVVHLRSCKPGSSSKPPPGLGGTESRVSTSRLASAHAVGRLASTEGNMPTSRDSTAKESKSVKELQNINPKVRRLPKDGNVDARGRKCQSCSAFEYDPSAKFCRECGTSLVSKQLNKPCTACGESVPEGSRFCGTCGVPINGAMADERLAGVENVNAPTVRVLTCPACKAICDADCNFCDNCGGVLGDAEPSTCGGLPAIVSAKEVMFCTSCGTSIEELSAKYCEDCGGMLERRAANTVNGGPPEAASTLAPGSVASQAIPGRISANAHDSPAPSSFPTVKAEARRASSRDNGQGMPSRTGKTNVASHSSGEGGRDCGRVSLPSPQREVQSHDASGMFNTLHEEVEDGGERLSCSNCGRKFAPESLSRHERVCMSQKKRKVFNMKAQRLAGTGATQVPKGSGGHPTALPPPKKDWRAESEAFRRAMREARMVDKVLKSGGDARDLPPPTYSENSHYTPCPHCGRKFAPDVAERHIPRCATTMNKPKPPPRRF
ncbi:hypothetical protein TRVL_07977 [Trypanosoma vivax]|nr:hypothetical protein TRVL_07977 [Trypanosoma vivax]